MNIRVALVIGIVVLAIALISVLFFFIGMTKKQTGKSSNSDLAKAKKIKHYLWFYNFYAKNPITKTKFLTLSKEVSDLSIYSHIESKLHTVKIFNTGVIMYFVLGSVTFFVFRNFITLMIVLLFILVFVDQFYYKSIQKIRRKLRVEELSMLSSLRQEYTRTRSVVEAFGALHVGPHISRAVYEIYTALSSNDVEEKLMQFAASTPLSTLQTLSSIAYVTDNKGDTLTTQGISTFATAIDFISDEVRMEIRRDLLVRQKFTGLEFFAIIPLIGVPIITAVISDMLPGTVAIYQGAIGFIFTVIILLASFICYKAIANATRSATVMSDDRSYLDKDLMSKVKVQQFIRRVRPKAYKKTKKQAGLIKKSLTRWDLDMLYLKKTYMAVLGFVLTLIVLTSSIFIGRAAVYDSVIAVSLSGSSGMTELDLYRLEAADELFMSSFLAPPTEEEVKAFVDSEMSFLSSSSRDSQVSRLMTKHSTYYGLTFKWWFFWVAFFVGWIMYGQPEKTLKGRAKIVATESEEDCLQLQTTIAILMNTTTDTLGVLDQLAMNSRVFKATLIDCYLNYTADAERALRTAKFSSDLLEFRTLMDKLSLTISQLTLSEVFSDLVSERDHILRMRETSQITALDKLRIMLKGYIYTPLGLFLVLMFIAPIGILAYSMFQDFMASGLF